MSELTGQGMTRASKLLREAAEWRLLGLLFGCPSADWRDQVTALAAEIADPALRVAAEAARQEAAEGLYHTVFGPGGPAAPREVTHRHTVDAGPFLADLEAFYRAFAYTPPEQEPPDHVSVEADFIAYLRFKEAYARSRGDQEQAEVTAHAASQFIEDHLSLIAEPLSDRLAASGIGYLSAAAVALKSRAGPPTRAEVAQAACAGTWTTDSSADAACTDG